MQLAVVSAHAQTQITSCGTIIKQPGEYVLANDLSCSGDGIIIGNNAKGVVVQLGGHRITGSSSPQRAGIRVQTGAGARIAGPGLITNYTAGFGVLLLSGSVDVSAVTCTGNDVGFFFSSGRAVVHSNIANNNVDGFYTSAEGDLTDNLATGNTQDGIATLARQRIRFFHNTAAFNGRYGIAALEHSTGKDIGFNTALNNAGYDLFDGNSECQNAWADNSSGTSKGPCAR